MEYIVAVLANLPSNPRSDDRELKRVLYIGSFDQYRPTPTSQPSISILANKYMDATLYVEIYYVTMSVYLFLCFMYLLLYVYSLSILIPHPLV